MNIGKKIKELRGIKNITQEQLAEVMGVTPQAVCKWESGKTMPDIALLPELSVFFGVTIDELFEITEDSHFERINNMIFTRNHISDSEFSYAERFLSERKDNPAAVSMLARLYECRMKEYRNLSQKLTKQALESNPEENIHSVLCGPLWSWDFTNHHELIDYYYRFTEKNPEIFIARVYLAELLIADMRLDEAGKVVCGMDKSIHQIRLKGKIEMRRGNIDNAKKLWDKMTGKYLDSDKAWSYKADFYAELGEYNKAIEFYNKSLSLAEKPRFIDNNLSLAHIYEILHDYSSAADEYEKIINILINEHNSASDSDVIKEYENKAAQCRKL